MEAMCVPQRQKYVLSNSLLESLQTPDLEHGFSLY